MIQKSCLGFKVNERKRIKMIMKKKSGLEINMSAGHPAEKVCESRSLGREEGRSMEPTERKREKRRLEVWN